jgi:hypothetical protein
MKKLSLILAAIIVTLGVSCQSDEEMVTPQISEALASKEIEYLAANFYKTVDSEEMTRLSNTYQAMDYEEASSFIEARYRIHLKEDMSVRQATSIRDLMHDVNKRVFEQTGQSYTNADQDIAVAVYASLAQADKYADAFEGSDDENKGSRTAAASCTNGNFFNTKSTIWNETTAGTLWPVNYIGLFNLNGTSDDCDYVLRSQNYNIYFRTAVIRPTSFAANWALAFNGSTTNPSREPGVNGSEARFEFLIGQDRVNLYYPGPNSASRFARDTRIVLVPR